METMHLTEQKTVSRFSVRPPSTHLAPHPETPSITCEGVTLCTTCNGAGYELLGHHDAQRCCQCNGDGTAR